MGGGAGRWLARNAPNGARRRPASRCPWPERRRGCRRGNPFPTPRFAGKRARPNHRLGFARGTSPSARRPLPSVYPRNARGTCTGWACECDMGGLSPQWAGLSRTQASGARVRGAPSPLALGSRCRIAEGSCCSTVLSELLCRGTTPARKRSMDGTAEIGHCSRHPRAPRAGPASVAPSCRASMPCAFRRRHRRRSPNPLTPFPPFARYRYQEAKETRREPPC